MSIQRYLRSKFFLTTLAVLIVGSILLFGVLYVKGYSNNQTTYRLETLHSSDLRPGVKVTYKGFRIGQLSKLILNSDGQVDSEVIVDNEYIALFRKGIQLKISKEKIVTTELVLTNFNQNEEFLKPNSIIPVYKDDVTLDLTKKIEPLLTKFNLLLDQLSDPKTGIVSSLNQSKDAIHETTKLISLISNKESGLPAVLQETQRTMSTLQPVGKQAEVTLKELQTTVVTMDQTLQVTKKLIEQVNDPELGIKSTLTHVQSATSSSELLIKNIDQSISDLTNAPIYKFLVPKKD
jgi:ABC-type transporter Mla subunit MlaD